MLTKNTALVVVTALLAGCADIDADALQRNLAAAYAFNQATVQPQVDALNAQSAALAAQNRAMQNMQSFGAAGVTAVWTGRQQAVTTITNQAGWACEYNYAGRTFVRAFTTTCPATVQVQ